MSAKDAARRPDALHTGHLDLQKREMCALEFIPNLGFSFEIGGSHQRTLHFLFEAPLIEGGFDHSVTSRRVLFWSIGRSGMAPQPPRSEGIEYIWYIKAEVSTS